MSYFDQTFEKHIDYSTIPGMFDFSLIYDRAVSYFSNDSLFVEIGCYQGKSTCYLGKQIKASRKNIKLYAIDHAQGSPDTTGLILKDHLGGSYASILCNNIINCKLQDMLARLEGRVDLGGGPAVS